MIAKRKSIRLLTIIIILAAIMLLAVGCSAQGVKIEFDTDGGSKVRAISVDINSTSSIEMPANPRKEGHIFVDWYLDEARTIAFNPSNIPTEDTTLYALWEVQEFTISFKAKLEDEFEYDVIYRTVSFGGSLVNNMPEVPTKKGYSGSWDVPAEKLSNIKEVFTIYAVYELRNFNMKFNVPGTTEPIVVTKVMGEEYEKPANPTNDGYVFGGWYTDTSYAIPYVFPPTMPSQDINLYAWWIKEIDIGGYYVYEATDYVGDMPTAIRITGITTIASYQENMLIPATIEGLPVKYIGFDTPYTEVAANDDEASYAIFNSTYLKSIIISNSIESIGTLAFNKAPFLEAITFMDNSQLKKIGDASFLNCTKVKEVYIPTSVETIGDYAFGGINLQPNEIMQLSIFNIANNSNLTSLGRGVFKECKFLENFRVPKTINNQIVYDGEEIDYDYGFYRIFEDSGIKNFTVETGHQGLQAIQGVLYSFDGATLLYYPNMGGVTYTLPETRAIGPNAFRNNSNIQSVAIANIVNNINGYAFYNAQNLKSVTFGNQSSLLNINKYAFSGATQIINLQLPSSLKSIHEYAFSAIGDIPMGLVSISLPEGLENIGKNAFRRCSNMTSLTMPLSVKTIDDYAFYDCHLLSLMYSAEADLKNSILEKIGDYAFYRCFNIVTLELPPSLLEIGDYAFSNDSKYTMNMQLRNLAIAVDSAGYRKLKTIGEGAFENCINLEQFNISEKVESIGQRAFYNCKALRVQFNQTPINNVLEEIKPYTFYGCTTLSIIIIPRTVTKIGAYAFFGNNSLVTVQSGTEQSLSGITQVGNSAFEGCIRLTSSGTYNQSLLFPNTTTVGKRAFYGCTALNNIIIVNSLTSIGEEAFANCINLITIRYGTNVNLTKLPGDLFKGCSALTNFKIPNSILEIEGNPFSNCDKLVGFTVDTYNTNYRVEASTQQNYNILYNKSDAKVIVLFPTGIETQFEVPSDVERIAPYAFYSSKITRLTFAGGATVVEIGDYAFAECKRLGNVTLSTRVYSVGNYAFHNSAILATITINEATDNHNTLTLGGYAFGKTAITTITIPERVVSIGEYAFNGCYRLAQLTFNQTTNYAENLIIDKYAFYECSKLTQLLLPSRLSHIDNFAFSWCVSLKTVSFSDSDIELTLGDNVFDNCHLIKSITLPNRLVQMGSNMFNGCSFLEYAEIQALNGIVFKPEGVTLGEYTFVRCNELRTVVIPNHISKIGEYAFYDCDNLIEIIFVDGSLALEIGAYALSECAAMVSFEIPARTTIVGDYAFYKSGLGREALYTIKDKQKVIAYKQNLTFAESAEELVLGEYSFASTNLSNITLPKRITEIGSFAFSDNKNLVSINFEEGSNCYYIAQGAFQNIASASVRTSNEVYEKLLDYDEFLYEGDINRIVLPEGLIELGNDVFKNSNNILDIVINEGLITIGEGAFSGLTKITYIDLPSSIIEIGANAFHGCVALQNVNIMNNGDYYLGNYAFSGCESLTSLSLRMVSMIGFAPAYGCENLTILIVDNENPYYKTIGNVLFTRNVTYGSGVDAKTYTEDEMILLYPAGKQGSTYAINRNTRELGAMAFSGNRFLTSISIDAKDASVLKISQDTFENTSLGLEFFVPNTHEFLYKQNNMWRPFANKIKSSSESVENFIIQILPGDSGSCRIVKYIGLADSGDMLVIPNALKGLKVKEIGENAFSYNAILRVVVIPQGLSTIASNAFSNCVALQSITISDSVQEIGEYAFHNCISLKNISIGEESLLSTISNYAFQNCISIEDITLPWRISSIGIFAFAGTAEKPMNLKEINIPSNSILTSIGSYAFQYASFLNIITIPQSVTLLGMNIFYGCSSLTSVILERGVNQTVTQLQNAYVFAGTPAELMIYVPRAARQEYIRERFWKNIATSIGEVESLNDQYSLEAMSYIYNAISVVEYLGVLNPDNVTYNKTYQSKLIMPDMAMKLSIVTINTSNKTFTHKTKGTVLSKGYSTLQEGATQIISLFDSNKREHRLLVRKVSLKIQGIRLLKYLGADVEVTVPSQIQGVPVLEIGSYCFNYKIENIIIPEGILKINSNAFRYSTRLKTVRLPMSLVTIENSAFRGNALQTVSIGNNEAELMASSLIEIGDYAFAGCTALASFIVPPQVDNIGNSAFAAESGRMSLTNVSFLNEKMKLIGKYAFSGTNIQTITLPEKLETIGEGAFKNCYYLLSVYLNDASDSSTIIKLEDGALEVFAGCNFVKIYVKGNKLSYYRNSEGTWNKTIARIFSSSNTYNGFSISIIDNEAKTAELVHYMGEDTNVIVPSQINGYTIQSISTYVFSYNVKTVTLPNTIRQISSYAFYNSGIEEIIFAPNSIVTSIGQYAFYDTPLKTIEIPISVTSLGDYVFANTQLSNVSFESPNQLILEGENITLGLTIGGYAFSNNETLNIISLPRRTTSIGQYAFYKNIKLGNIALPLDGQIDSIASYAFAQCSSLVQITIPFSVRQIYTSVFDYCTSLESVYIMRGKDGVDINEVDGLTTAGPGLFNNIVNPFLKVYVPRNSLNEYKSMANWRSYAGYSESGTDNPLAPNYIVPNLIYGDFSYAILDASSIELTHYRGTDIDLIVPGSIEIGTIIYNVKSIGRYFGNRRLRSVVIEAGYKQQLNIFAFSECTALERLVLPSSMEIIGDYAFNNCIKLRTINIPETIIDINKFVFQNCTSLKELFLPSTIVNIKEGAFKNCTSLIRLHLNTVGIIEGGGSMLMNSSPYLRIFVSSEYLIAYRTKTIWSLYASNIISKDSIYGNYAIETLQNGQINILQYIGYEKDMFVPTTLQGSKVESIAKNSIIAFVEKIYLPEGSIITYSGSEADRIIYYEQED